MKALITMLGLLAPVTAFAAETARTDNSGIFVWIFLGFCALIVVMQIVPAIMLAVGMGKGVVSVMKEVLTPHKG